MEMKKIRLSKSVIGQREADSVTKVLLEDGYLGMGTEVGLFEKEIANYIGVQVENVVCVNTGTSALHLAVEAVVTKGGEVLVPSFTYLASYQAISAAGALPISCDVYEDTLTIDLDDAKKRITNKTQAIMAVHYGSNPANIEQLYDFAKINNLRVIEDAAHAFGCKYKGKKIGSFGDIVCFSFDGIKNITSGEGGAIITKDINVLSIVKDARLLSTENDSENRYLGKRSWDFDVKRQGYRYHMSNVFAAIGRVQLSRFDAEFAPKRISLLNKYKELLSENSLVVFQKQEAESYLVPHICSIRILGNMRDELKEILESNNIPTGIHYKPNHLLSFYKSSYSLPLTEQAYGEILTLPLHPEIEIFEVEQICHIININLI
jgi:dTDP-4-amino-4,6-dideoxygalactose transaminase